MNLVPVTENITVRVPNFNLVTRTTFNLGPELVKAIINTSKLPHASKQRPLVSPDTRGLPLLQKGARPPAGSLATKRGERGYLKRLRNIPASIIKLPRI